MNIHVIFEHGEIKYTHTINYSHGIPDASTVFPCIIARLLTVASLTWTIETMYRTRKIPRSFIPSPINFPGLSTET